MGHGNGFISIKTVWLKNIITIKRENKEVKVVCDMSRIVKNIFEIIMQKK